jgi:hypothetical protein
MSQNLNPCEPIEPLDVDNLISAGLRLYRNHLTVYVGIAFRAILWKSLSFLVLNLIPRLLIYEPKNLAILGLLIPLGLVLFFYGMAKHIANSALISRLAFRRLINKPESPRKARHKVDPKINSFLRSYLVYSFLIFTISLEFVAFVLALGVLGNLMGIFAQNNRVILVICGLLSIIVFGIGLIVSIRIYLRLFMYEVPLAIEERITAIQTIRRSWNLTKNHVRYVFWIITVAFLTLIPIYIIYFIVQVIVNLLCVILLSVLSTETTLVDYSKVSLIVGYVLKLVSDTFILPFWQAIKAVVYYDLRSRREGLGMQLR